MAAPAPFTSRMAIDLLQSAFDADPAAMCALVNNRVPCNVALANHAQVVCDEIPIKRGNRPGMGQSQVGLLGVVNGLLKAAGQAPIAACFSNETDEDGRNRMIGFGSARSKRYRRPLT